MNRLATLASLTLLTLVACTNESGDTPRQLDQPRSVGGIAGTLRDESPEPDGGALEGQVVVWPTEPGAAINSEPTRTFGRPLAAALVIDSQFLIELGPGWYRVRGTALGGQVCNEVTVEVKPNETARIHFVCR